MARETDRIMDKWLSSRLTLFVLLALVTSPPAWSQLLAGSMDVHWNEGSPNCANDPQPPLQQHQYNTGTYILRENLCTTRFPNGIRATGYGVGYSAATIIPAFSSFYMLGLKRVGMPYEQTQIVILAVGGFLLLLGALTGPETNHVELS